MLDVWGPVSGWYRSPATLRFALASPLWESNSLCPSARSGSAHLLYYRGEDILQDYEDCMKSARIRSYFGPHFLAFGLREMCPIRSYSGPHFPALWLYTERCVLSVFSPNVENADQNNSKHEHFSCSEILKVSVFGVILVHIFPHPDWIRRDTQYVSVFSPNAEKCGT